MAPPAIFPRGHFEYDVDEIRICFLMNKEGTKILAPGGVEDDLTGIQSVYVNNNQEQETSNSNNHGKIL